MPEPEPPTVDPLREAEAEGRGGEMRYDPRLELPRTWGPVPTDDPPGTRGVDRRVSVDLDTGEEPSPIEQDTWPEWRQTHA